MKEFLGNIALSLVRAMLSLFLGPFLLVAAGGIAIRNLLKEPPTDRFDSALV